jgi:sulfopyruvate decarboxylase subunit beta
VIEADVFRLLFESLTDEALIVANGYLSRRAFHCRDRATTFYMVGSMGQASSIGLGVALARPERRVVVVDGDGNLLMSLGALAMVANSDAKNVIHIVIDNQEYASTGGQRGIATAEWPKLALAAGYCSAYQLSEEIQLRVALQQTSKEAGPAFLQVKVSTGIETSPRVGRQPEEIAITFKKSLAS